MSHNYASAISAPIHYNVTEWVESDTMPYCLNDQPLPFAFWNYPQQTGLGYAAGAVFSATFSAMSETDLAWIAQAVLNPVTFTFWDKITGNVRGPATATFVGLTLTITLTKYTDIGLETTGMLFI